MNKVPCLASKGRFVLSSALIGALAGCTTYVERPQQRVTYETPPPVYETPPPVVQTPPPVYATPPPVEEPVVTIQAESDFYEPLGSYGEWVAVSPYGRCWRPSRVDADWRPYCNGHWERTDAGWYWASDEPWGWATYHYGRWDWSAQFGWIWVPQTQWAPAWVSWRQGAGYVGWAALPPSARVTTRGVVEVRETPHAPRAFVFVEEPRLLEPVRPTTVVVNNTTVINKTVNITKINVVNKTVINEGPPPEVVERVSGRRVQPVPVRELRRRDEREIVTRQRNLPSTTEKNSPLPAPGTREQRAVPPRETRRVEQPVETTTQPPPTVTRKGIVETREQQPRPEKTVRPRETRPVEKAAEAPKTPQRPAATPPAATKKEIQETGRPQPAVKPAQPQLEKAASDERRREIESAKVKSKTRPEIERPVRPETERTAAMRRPIEPQPAKQAEVHLKSLKSANEKAVAGRSGEPAKRKKDDRKKGDEIETAPQQPAAPGPQPR